MAIRKIVEKGDEILAKKCKPVKEVTKHIQTVTRDMIDTMIEADGVCRPELEDPEHNYVFINPEILEKEGEQDSLEGCLSVPGYIGHVVRPEKVRIQGLDAEGEMQDLVFDGFAATCICHEYDHLDGILYTDRSDNVMTNEEYAEILKKQEEEER